MGYSNFGRKIETISEKILFWFLIISLIFAIGVTIKGFRFDDPLLISEGVVTFAMVAFLNTIFKCLPPNKKEKDRGPR